MSFPGWADAYGEGARSPLRKGVHVPRPHPPEFRRRAVEPARERAKPVAEPARDLGIGESCLRDRMAKADAEEGRREGLTSAERAELVELRRKLRVAEMENEILRRAAAYFARENVLPKRPTPSSPSAARTWPWPRAAG